tara:strand:- start:106 stop:393 length:288 start_codon:yes stop_codon:yes gene_type:complete
MLGFSPLASSPIAANARAKRLIFAHAAAAVTATMTARVHLILSAGAAASIHAIVQANARYKWEPQPITPETWTPAPTSGDTWTPAAVAAETWTEQ